MIDLSRRPRRNRKSTAIRTLTQETHLLPHQCVVPLFIIEGEGQKEALPLLPGNYRFSIDLLIEETQRLYGLGVRAVDLFAYIPQEKKHPEGREALNPNNLLCHALSTLKKEIPEMCLMVDVALDPYTTHGHDGLVSDQGEIMNDATLTILSHMSLNAARAGADVIAPSDMMDGRVAHIRKTLDKADFTDVSILAYTAKYASSFYGPFRDCLGSTPSFGDKKTYQMSPANRREALIEAHLDETEGADFLLVKPAHTYLDIIADLREATALPIAAYHVSGEYAMLAAAAEKGLLNFEEALREVTTAIKRAGADLIFTYGFDHLFN